MEILLKRKKLNDITLDNYGYDIESVPGTLIGNILGKTEGSSLSVNSDQVSIENNRLLVGPGVQYYEEIFEISLIETLEGYKGSPKPNLLALYRLGPPYLTSEDGSPITTDDDNYILKGL